jgi:hypothetical protein
VLSGARAQDRTTEAGEAQIKGVSSSITLLFVV